MTVSDATLRALAGEHDRLAASRTVAVSGSAARDIAMVSELAAELLRRRLSSQESDQLVALRCEAIAGDYPAACEAIDRMTRPPAAAAVSPPPDRTLSTVDRDTLARFAIESPHPVESAAVHALLSGRLLTEPERDVLVLFAASGRTDDRWPRTREALRRALDGAL
jgi:hypothetical protein